MSTQPLVGKQLLRKVGPSLVTAFIALAALAISGQSLRAQTAQGEVVAALATFDASKTILTAKAADLAHAVALAVTSNTDVSITPADIAAAAFQPFPPTDKVRSDRESSAAVVTSTLATLYLSNTNNTLNTDETNIAAITVAVADVNQPTKTEDLTTAGQTAVVGAAISAVSVAGLTNRSLLAVDTSIGAALTADPTLEGLIKDGLATITEGAMADVVGPKKVATSAAPEAAEAFAEGLLSVSGSVPDGETYGTYAVSLLGKVSANTSVDELVSYQFGLAIGGTNTGTLVTTATTLYKKYSSAVTKITQGIVAAVPAGVDIETNRVSLLKLLSTAAPKDAATLDQGASFTDPNYAYAFTLGVFNGVGPTTFAKDAPTIATDEGNVLGQDGTQLVSVANVFADLTGSGSLLASKASTYAGDLVSGAVKSKIPSTQFTGAAAGLGGGTLLPALNGKNSDFLPTVTVDDLGTIADLFTQKIYSANLSSSNSLKLDETEIGATVEAIAKAIKDDSFTDSVSGQSSAVSTGDSASVAAFLAATVADVVQAIDPSNASAIDGYIDKDVEAAAPGDALPNGATKVTEKSLISAAVGTSTAVGTGTNFEIGAISPEETAVTNL